MWRFATIAAASLTSGFRVRTLLCQLQSCRWSEYKRRSCFLHIEIKASVFMQAKETEVFARLGDIVVTDANPKTVHRKVRETHGPAVSLS